MPTHAQLVVENMGCPDVNLLHIHSSAHLPTFPTKISKFALEIKIQGRKLKYLTQGCIV